MCLPVTEVTSTEYLVRNYIQMVARKSLSYNLGTCIYAYFYLFFDMRVLAWLLCLMMWRQKAKMYRLTALHPFLQGSLRLSSPQVLLLCCTPMGASEGVLSCASQKKRWHGWEGKRRLTTLHHMAVPGMHILSDKDWRKGTSQWSCFSGLVFKGERQDGGSESEA